MMRQKLLTCHSGPAPITVLLAFGWYQFYSLVWWNKSVIYRDMLGISTLLHFLYQLGTEPQPLAGQCPLLTAVLSRLTCAIWAQLLHNSCCTMTLDIVAMTICLHPLLHFISFRINGLWQWLAAIWSGCKQMMVVVIWLISPGILLWWHILCYFWGPCPTTSLLMFNCYSPRSCPGC